MPRLGECLCGDSGTCADLVQENCDPLGRVVWQSDPGVVTGAANCQEWLQVLGPELGDEVFSYSSEDKVCTILDRRSGRPAFRKRALMRSTPTPLR